MKKTKEKGIVYKMTCRTSSFTYVGESRRNWKSQGPNTSPEPLEMSIPQLNSMQKPATIYILVTPKFYKQEKLHEMKEHPSQGFTLHWLPP